MWLERLEKWRGWLDNEPGVVAWRVERSIERAGFIVKMATPVEREEKTVCPEERREKVW